MLGRTETSAVFVGLVLCLRGSIAIEEKIVDIIDGDIGRVLHIAGIETVIAEIIEHYLVGGEILRPAGICGTYPVDGQKKGRLACPVAVKTVGEVPYGADCKDDMNIFRQRFDDRRPHVGNFVYRQPPTIELRCRELVAVADDRPAALEYECRSECYDKRV